MIEVHSATDFEPSVGEGRKDLSPEIPAWDFGGVREAAQSKWAENLSRVGFEPANPSNRRTFCPALRDVAAAPTLCHGAAGSRRGPDGRVHFTPGFKYCSTFSPRGTFHAEQPLLAVIQPERVNHFSCGNDDGGQMCTWHVRSAPGLNPLNPLAGNYVVDCRLGERKLHE